MAYMPITEFYSSVCTVIKKRLNRACDCLGRSLEAECPSNSPHLPHTIQPSSRPSGTDRVIDDIFAASAHGLIKRLLN